MGSCIRPQRISFHINQKRKTIFLPIPADSEVSGLFKTYGNTPLQIFWHKSFSRPCKSIIGIFKICIFIPINQFCIAKKLCIKKTNLPYIVTCIKRKNKMTSDSNICKNWRNRNYSKRFFYTFYIQF